MHNSGNQILAQCIERYAGLRSYQDRGVVRTWYPGDSEPHELSFMTSFMKPKFFRFEFLSLHPFLPLRHVVTKHVCGFDGAEAYSVTQRSGESAVVELEESLKLAVAGATGISGGSAHTIARLLLPEIGGFSLSKLADVNLEREAEVEGALCYELTGVHPRGGPHTLWIGKSDLLLRKLSERVRDSPSEEIRSAIIVDADLEPSVFGIPQ